MGSRSTQQEDVAEFYDDEATTYDNRFATKAGQYIHERQVSILLEELGDIEDKRILEIAAGTGRFTRELVDQGADVVVLDISREMLVQNRSKSPEAEFLHGSATSLPFGDNSFDACVTINALNHIPGHWDAVAEVYRILDQNGKFVANYPNLLSNRLPIACYVNWHNRNVGGGVYTKWFNIHRAKSRLKNTGYTISKCRGDRLVPVKAASSITVPLAKAMEDIVESAPLAELCVSPFITAVKE